VLSYTLLHATTEEQETMHSFITSKWGRALAGLAIFAAATVSALTTARADTARATTSGATTSGETTSGATISEATISEATTAQAATPTPAPALDEIGGYALFAEHDIDWHGSVAMPEHMNLGSNTGAIRFAASTAANASGSAVAATTVELQGQTTVGMLYAGNIIAGPDAVIENQGATPTFPLVSASRLPLTPAIECGGATIVVGTGNSPYVLEPGRYDTVTVTRDQRIELVPGGHYELCRMNLNRGSSILVDASNTILIRDFLSSETRVRFDGPSACGARWVALGVVDSGAPNSAAFDFGDGNGQSNRALIAGQFFTPARIAMEQHNDYVGRFWADSILAGPEDMVSRTLSSCNAAFCGDGNLDEGEECDDGNNSEGDCCTALCRIGEVSSSCDDGLFCTKTDTCNASGDCRGTTSPCIGPDSDDNCSESCDEASRTCTAPDPYDSPCDDGLFCDGSEDRCRAGICEGTQSSPCPGPDGDGNCNESCNENAQDCSAPDPADASCDDGLFCTTTDTCREGGVCAGSGSPCPSPDGDSNCSESCDEETQLCVAPDLAGSPCSDGLFCTAIDQCDGNGQCTGKGDPCPGADGDGDCSERCDEATQSCDAPDPEGSACQDGSPCSLGDSCSAGTCLSGEEVSCNDGNPCTQDFCDPEGGCTSVFNQAPCDDRNGCTTVDRCELGVCIGSQPVDCSDGDLCNVDTCDPRDGSCRSATIPAQDCNEDGDGRTQFVLPFLPAAEISGDGLRSMWRGNRDGVPTTREQIADPTIGEAWALCVFDTKSGTPELRHRLNLDPSTTPPESWKRRETKNKLIYKLNTSDGNSDGVSAVKMLVDRHHRAVFKLAAGANVGCRSDCRLKFQAPEAIDDERLFAMEPETIMQWKSSKGACWSTRYAEANENSPLMFNARQRAPK
jgi:hypothetical protein